MGTLTFGQALRQARQQLGLSLRDLARLVHFDHSYLSQIERGVRPGSAELAKRCDDVLGTGGALLSVYEAEAALRGEGVDATRRRTVVQALTTLAVGASAPLVSLEAARQGLSWALDGGRRGVDEWEALALEYARDFYTTPPAALLQDIVADVVVLQQLTAAGGDAQKRDLYRVAGQLSVVMAMTLASLGQTRAARRWWNTARQAADASGDAVTRVWVRDWEAVNGLYEQRPLPVVLELVDEALAIGGHLATAGTAGVLAGKAQALAVCGRADEATIVLRQIEEVSERLPTDVTADAESMHGWPEVRLRYTESYVHTYLGNTAAAYAAQDRALALYPANLARERAQLQMHRAACLVIDGHVGDGLAYANEVLAGLPDAWHNEMLFATAAKVIDSVPDSERGRPAVAELRAALTRPAALSSL